jgi:hypothetical protein
MGPDADANSLDREENANQQQQNFYYGRDAKYLQQISNQN